MAVKARIESVKRRSVPEYPDRYSVELKPLLLANKPLRWKAAPVAGTVLSAVVLLGLAGCSEDVIMQETPLFEHGGGIGAFGCMSVAAPVFLSEDDAFAVISDEFSKINLTVEKGGVTAAGIQIPVVQRYHTRYDTESGTVEEPETVTGDLAFDFTVQDKKIVIEFVSSGDLEAWFAPTTYWSSIDVYYFKETARVLNDSLNQERLQNNHAVFYDPVEYADYVRSDAEKSFERNKIETHERACEVLREQVRDFLEWLSAQGII